MKRFLLVTMLLAIAAPAVAIDEIEAEFYGRKETELLCEAIWQGAKSISAAYEVVLRNPYLMNRATLIDNIKKIRGENDPIYQSYQKGVAKAIYQCLPEIEKLTGK